MDTERMDRAYDEIVRHLKAFNLLSTHAEALASLLLADVVVPEVRAARDAERQMAINGVLDDVIANLETGGTVGAVAMVKAMKGRGR